ALLMTALGRGEVPEEVPDLRVLGLAGGPEVVAGGLELHERDAPPDLLDAPRAERRQGIAPDEAAHVVAADERDLLTVLLAEELDQAPAVRLLLLLHRVELGRGLREVRAQTARELLQEARVLLLEGDREREDLGRREVGELSLHGRE